MLKIVGYTHSKGEGTIQGVFREWDNYLFDCITDTNHNYTGLSNLQLKVKTLNVFNVFGVNSFEELNKFVGHEVIPNYIPVGKNTILDSVVLADKK